MTSQDTVTTLQYKDKTITLVGTAHVSNASVEEVQQVIEQLQPDTVCVELCQARYNALISKSSWQNLDIFQVIKQGKTLFLLGNLAIASYQRRLGKQLGVKPGAELVAATKSAELCGAQVCLADRDINQTLKRTWRNIGFWKKWQLLGSVIAAALPGGQGDKIGKEEIEELKSEINLSKMLTEFSKQFPGVKKPLIDERDLYLISKIREAPGKNIVGVVGAAHVPGMKANLHTEVDRDELSIIPPPAKWVSLVKWIFPLIVLSAFYLGYRKHGGQSVQDMLSAWILPNSILAGVCTAIAGGKFWSVVVAFIGSPITSLNPLLPIGVLVGYVEAKLRKPTVADCEKLQEISSLRQVYQNKFSRVLLVAFMSIMGSALGAWVALPWILALL